MFVLRLVISVLLGFLLGLTNLYIALKIGFTVGVAILSVFCWGGLDWALQRIWAAWSPLTRQDYACYQSLASAMSYGCGTVIATALAALLMSGEGHYPAWSLIVWVMGLCGLGTCLAVPLRRRMLADLPFPSGKVAAQTVDRLEERNHLQPFFITIFGVWLWIGLRDFLRLIPARFPGFTETLYLQNSPLLLGLGALLRLRVCGSLFAGGCVFFILVPWFIALPETDGDPIMWFAIGMMISAGLADFGHSLWQSRQTDKPDSGSIDLPGFWVWFSLSLGLIVVANIFGFGVSLVSLLWVIGLVWLFSVLACRVTGSIDVVPTGALGKISLLLMGFMQPGQLPANMVNTGSLTGSSAASADFMTDLRCGTELGCPPTKLFKYQFAGALLGPLIFVPLFLLLISGDQPLGGEVFPAPAAQLWLTVAAVTHSVGSEDLELYYRFLKWGLVCGVFFFSLSKIKKIASWVPSAVPFATAVILDWSTVFMLFLGALLGHWISREKGFKIWCAMIAAESSATVLLLVLL